MNAQAIDAADLYPVSGTASGYAVTRANGDCAEFLWRAEAAEAASRLSSGDADESDFVWAAAEVTQK